MWTQRQEMLPRLLWEQTRWESQQKSLSCPGSMKVFQAEGTACFNTGGNKLYLPHLTCIYLFKPHNHLMRQALTWEDIMVLMRKQGTERLNKLLKVTKQVENRRSLWTQRIKLLGSHYSPLPLFWENGRFMRTQLGWCSALGLEIVRYKAGEAHGCELKGAFMPGMIWFRAGCKNTSLVSWSVPGGDSTFSTGCFP